MHDQNKEVLELPPDVDTPPHLRG